MKFIHLRNRANHVKSEWKIIVYFIRNCKKATLKYIGKKVGLWTILLLKYPCISPHPWGRKHQSRELAGKIVRPSADTNSLCSDSKQNKDHPNTWCHKVSNTVDREKTAAETGPSALRVCAGHEPPIYTDPTITPSSHPLHFHRLSPHPQTGKGTILSGQLTHRPARLCDVGGTRAPEGNQISWGTPWWSGHVMPGVKWILPLFVEIVYFNFTIKFWCYKITITMGVPPAALHS